MTDGDILDLIQAVRIKLVYSKPPANTDMIEYASKKLAGLTPSGFTLHLVERVVKACLLQMDEELMNAKRFRRTALKGEALKRLAALTGHTEEHLVVLHTAILDAIDAEANR